MQLQYFPLRKDGSYSSERAFADISQDSWIVQEVTKSVDVDNFELKKFDIIGADSSEVQMFRTGTPLVRSQHVKTDIFTLVSSKPFIALEYALNNDCTESELKGMKLAYRLKNEARVLPVIPNVMYYIHPSGRRVISFQQLCDALKQPPNKIWKFYFKLAGARDHDQISTTRQGIKGYEPTLKIILNDPSSSLRYIDDAFLVTPTKYKQWEESGGEYGPWHRIEFLGTFKKANPEEVFVPEFWAVNAYYLYQFEHRPPKSVKKIKQSIDPFSDEAHQQQMAEIRKNTEKNYQVFLKILQGAPRPVADEIMSYIQPLRDKAKIVPYTLARTQEIDQEYVKRLLSEIVGRKVRELKLVSLDKAFTEPSWLNDKEQGRFYSWLHSTDHKVEKIWEALESKLIETLEDIFSTGTLHRDVDNALGEERYSRLHGAMLLGDVTDTSSVSLSLSFEPPPCAGPELVRRLGYEIKEPFKAMNDVAIRFAGLKLAGLHEKAKPIAELLKLFQMCIPFGEFYPNGIPRSWYTEPEHTGIWVVCVR